MIIVIDNSQRKLRERLRLGYLSRGIPCVVCRCECATDHLPCRLIQVTEQYLLNDARYIAESFGNIPVVVSDSIVDIEIPKKTFIVPTDFGVTYCKKNIRLTKTEKLIVDLMLLHDGWVEAETLAEYCMKKPSAKSISVHVCNINAKTMAATRSEMIECRRYKGYRLRKIN